MGHSGFLLASSRHHLVQGQIRHHALQARILVAELLELARFTGQHAAGRLLPAVERLLRNPDPSAQVADGAPGLGLLQDPGDLLYRMTRSLHGTLPGLSGLIVPRITFRLV